MLDPIAFPIFTGTMGISTGTQYPPGYPSPSTATPSTSPSSQATTTNPNPGPLSNPSPTPTITSHSSSPTPAGAIAGGVVGGLAVFVGAVAFLIIRRRRQASLRSVQVQSPPHYEAQDPRQEFHKAELDGQQSVTSLPLVQLGNVSPHTKDSLHGDGSSLGQVSYPYSPITGQKPMELRGSEPIYEAP
jgi:hypothetical protein